MIGQRVFQLVQWHTGGLFNCNTYCCWLHTPLGESKLYTSNCSIRSSPWVITHCPPLVVIAHFHSSLQLIGSTHHTNISSCAVGTIHLCQWNKCTIVSTVMAFSIYSSINLRNYIFCHCNFNNSRSARNALFRLDMVIWVIRGFNNSNSQSSNFYNLWFWQKYLFPEPQINRANTIFYIP